MKYRFLVLSILMSQFLFAQEADYIIRNGKLIDGTGNQWQIKDVAIINNKIAAIGTLTKWKGKKEIDAKGLIVSPGFIETELTLQNNNEEAIAKILERVPLNRLGTTSEVASLVGFLGSKENTYITGQVINIDGGFSIS